jgi:hypothetical protein
MRLMLAVALLLVSADPLLAQKSARVEPIFITVSDSGQEIRASLLQMNDASLAVVADGQRRTIPLDRVLRIQVAGDSPKNGALIGALVGGIWCAIVCGQGLSNASEIVPFALINAGVSAAIGASIDMAIPGRRTIYSKPLPSPSAQARGATGFALKVRF